MINTKRNRSLAITLGLIVGLIAFCIWTQLPLASAVSNPQESESVNKTESTKPTAPAVDSKSKPKTEQESQSGTKSTNPKQSAQNKSKSTESSQQEKQSDAEQTDPLRPLAEKDPRPKIIRRKNGIVDKNKSMDLTFDDLSFEMEKGGDFKRNMLTKQINDLEQQKVRLRGFIRPSVRQTDLTKFVFVRDNKECCFGPGAALYDCVLVELDKDEKTDFTVRPVTIEGTFYLKEFKVQGKTWAIYRMKNGVVK